MRGVNLQDISICIERERACTPLAHLLLHMPEAYHTNQVKKQAAPTQASMKRKNYTSVQIKPTHNMQKHQNKREKKHVVLTHQHAHISSQI